VLLSFGQFAPTQLLCVAVPSAFAMASSLKVFCWLSAIAILPWSSNGQGFLGYNPKLNAALAREQIEDAIGEAFGSGHGIESEQLKVINSTIAPMFAVMPKNSEGRIGTGMMRHAVHRYFGEVHNWVVRGFEPHTNVSEPSGAAILRSQLPMYAEAIIEKRLSHGGFALGDVVTAVAVVEQLILNEVLQTVHSSYALNEYPMSRALSSTEMVQILQSYIIVELLEGNPDDNAQHKSDKENIREIYPNWDHTSLFLADLVGDDVYQHKHALNPFKENLYHFEDIARIAQDFSQEFSHWADHECKAMKETLMDRDLHATGRIRLADFYRTSDDGAWQFLESTDYLRQLGALDESSKALGPQVILPNYLTGMSNCISSTPFYSACCRNECNGLMSELEGHVGTPLPTAAEVAKAVGLMSSSSQATRNLSMPLRMRLDEVASFHGGKVPLHGRLLSQWMHFAFPRECSFPHVSGTVSPKTPGQYMEVAGDEGVAGEEEIAQHLNAEYAKGPTSPEAGLSMWILQEELIEAQQMRGGSRSIVRDVLRSGVLLVMIGCMVYFVVQQLSTINSFVSGNGKQNKEYMV